MPNNLKGYDAFQVLRSVFDVDKNCLRVCVVDGTTGGGGGFEVIISHLNDSIRLGDGVNLITSTSLLGKVGLDVNVINEVNTRQLDASIDNVSISDGTDVLDINPDGSINVNILGSGGATSVNKYNEITSIATATETVVSTHTAVGGRITYLQSVSASGGNIAKYRVKVNGSTIDMQRTNHGSSLNVYFSFIGTMNNGVLLSVGDVVTITAIHQRGMVADFNGRLQLIEVI